MDDEIICVIQDADGQYINCETGGGPNITDAEIFTEESANRFISSCLSIDNLEMFKNEYDPKLVYDEYINYYKACKIIKYKLVEIE